MPRFKIKHQRAVTMINRAERGTTDNATRLEEGLKSSWEMEGACLCPVLTYRSQIERTNEWCLSDDKVLSDKQLFRVTWGTLD